MNIAQRIVNLETAGKDESLAYLLFRNELVDSEFVDPTNPHGRSICTFTDGSQLNMGAFEGDAPGFVVKPRQRMYAQAA